MGLDVMDLEHLEPHVDVGFYVEEGLVEDGITEAAEGENMFLLAHENKMRRSSPWRTYVILTTVSLNFFVVPGLLAGMGWALVVISMTWGYCHSFVTGLMLDKISEEKPQILSYPDMGAYVGAKLSKGSKHGRRAGFWVIWVSQAMGIFLICAANMGFAAQFFQAIFPQPCYTWWIVITYGFIVLLSQVPTFHHSFQFALVSMISMMAVFVLLVVNMCITGTLEDVSYRIGDAPLVYNGIAGICFAYGGHSIYPEARREMKEPEKFKRCIYMIYATIGLTMGVIGFLGYGMFGTEAQVNLFDNLTSNVSVDIANIVILFTVFGNLVVGNILSMMAIQTVLKIPLLGWKNPRSYGMPVGVTRTLLRVAVLTLELLLALAIPFLSDLVGLTGAISSVMLTFMFPCIAYWVVFNKTMSICMKLNCAFLIALSVLVCVIGCYGAFAEVISSATAFPLFHLPCSYLDLP